MAYSVLSHTCVRYLLTCIYTYLQTFGNQKSGHFRHCSNNPPPPPLEKDQSFPSNPAGSLDAETLIDRALHSTSKSTSHLYICFRSIKYISSQFAEKRPGKILIYDVFKYYFKNMNIYRLKFYKIGASRFLEVLKVKYWDCWQVNAYIYISK